MAPKAFRASLTRLGVLTARPAAFIILAIYVVVWLFIDRKSFDMHGVATVATWLMTLFIQRAEHRDTQAIQAKLDELLRAVGDADEQVKHIDKEEPEEIEAEREGR